MRTVLHIGPYKTGTTSVQTYLLDAIGRKSPNGYSTWYPYPESGGPGHSAMAYEALRGDGSRLMAAVETAQKSGVSQLVLSSEAFSAAYPRKISKLVPMLGDDVHLMITLNSPVRRAVATWQELVKHAHPLDLSSSYRHIFKRPEYQGDFISKFSEAINPSKISLIFSSARDPASFLIENVCKAIGLPPANRGADIRKNVRQSLIEVELLRALNALLVEHAPDLPKARYTTLRQLLLSTLRTPKWVEACPQIPVRTPERFLPRLKEVAEKTLDEIRSLPERWPVEIYGDTQCLLEVPAD